MPSLRIGRRSCRRRLASAASSSEPPTSVGLAHRPVGACRRRLVKHDQTTTTQRQIYISCSLRRHRSRDARVDAGTVESLCIPHLPARTGPLRRVLTGRQVQPPREIRPADFADEVGVAADHELVAGAGQPDVEAFAGAFECRLLVDDEHDGAALEPLEAEDVAVEDLLGIPEAVPVGGAAGGLAFLLFGMAGAGRQQRDVFGAPPSSRSSSTSSSPASMASSRAQATNFTAGPRRRGSASGGRRAAGTRWRSGGCCADCGRGPAGRAAPAASRAG